ncbi:MAG: OmpA/MotB family protein [Desulfovibrio sp.]
MATKTVIQEVIVPGPKKEEGLPLWMATFADMVTLLLCFFVLLLSFAEQNVAKFRDVLGSVKGAFGVKQVRPIQDDMALLSTRKKEMRDSLSDENKVLLGVIMRIKSLFDQEQKKMKGTGVSQDRNGALLTIGSNALFDKGSAKLRPEAKLVLDKVLTILKEFNYNLVTRGHTSKGESGGRYATGWELSAARAAAAIEYISAHDIAVNRLRAVGYSDTRPNAPNNTKAGRQENRRIEFYFHRPESQAF